MKQAQPHGDYSVIFAAVEKFETENKEIVASLELTDSIDTVIDMINSVSSENCNYTILTRG